MAISWDKIIITVDDEIVNAASGQVMILASGVPGHSATIAVGTVTTLPAGSPATVENVGDENDAIFNFGIPKGADGDNAPEWGSITGTLADQTDLKAALDAKADAADLQDLEDAVADKASVITPTVTDSLITLTDAANAPVKSLTVAIEPVQDLHGYDAPWPAGGGKNIFNIDNISTGTFNGITVSKSGNTISYSGTAIDSGWKSTIAVLTLPDGTWHCHLEGDAYWLENYTSKGKDYTVTVSGGTPVMRLSLVNAVAGQSYSGTVTNIQIEAGSSATSFAPYSNICPITGWTGCNVYRTGKNLLPNVKYQASTTNAVIGQNVTNGTRNIYLPVGTYTISVTSSTSGTIYYRGPDDNINHRMSESGVLNGTLNITKAGMFCFWVYNPNGISIEAITSFQLELGSAASDYEPYSGISLTIPFGQTVYGATLDVLTGTLTVDRAMVDLGTLTWRYNNSGYFFAYDLSSIILAPSTNSKVANILCESYTPDTAVNSSTKNGAIGVNSTGTVILCNQSITTVEALITALANTKLVYALFTPLTIQLSPSTLNTLLGQNNLWADTGDVTVTYRADTKLYIDSQISASARATRSLIAGIETTGKATKNYSIDDLLIVGDALYKVTSVITSGETIAEGTNVTSTTVAEQLILLANS